MLFQYAQVRYMFRQGQYWEPKLDAPATKALQAAAP
jgi:hypothetical protein